MLYRWSRVQEIVSVNHELEEFAAQTVGLNPLSDGKSVIR